jgi:alkaline phosphatase
MNSRFPPRSLAAATAAALMLALGPATSAVADDDFEFGRSKTQERFPKGSVIFFHPDGTGANHWNVARMYFEGLDGQLNWDRLPHAAR